MINYFYGPYIRVLREKYHVPQHKLAKKLFLSNGTLSKFEQGKQDMDFDTFSSAISFFEKQESDFIFSTNPEDLENPKIEIQKFIHLFIQLDYWKELPRLEERVPHFDSYGFFYEVLLEAFRLYLKKKPYTKEIDFLLAHLNQFEPVFVCLIQDLKGLDLKHKNRQIEGLLWFEKAKLLSNRLNYYGLTGLIEYHEIISYLDLFEPAKALSFCDSCRQHLQQAVSYRRIIVLDMNKASAFIPMNAIEEAKSIYKSLLAGADTFPDLDLKTTLWGNLSWCFFLQSDYEEAIKCAKQSHTHSKDFPDYWIPLVYGNFKLKKREEALDWIVQYEKFNFLDARSRFIGLFFKLVYHEIKQNDKMFDRIREQVLKKMNKFPYVELDETVYELIIIHAKRLQDIDGVLNAQEQLISFYKNKRIGKVK